MRKKLRKLRNLHHRKRLKLSRKLRVLLVRSPQKKRLQQRKRWKKLI
jgi:hypothetical protein